MQILRRLRSALVPKTSPLEVYTYALQFDVNTNSQYIALFVVGGF